MAIDNPPTPAILATLRRRAGLSQDQAGARLGLIGAKRRTSVSNWETEKSSPSAKHRIHFIDYLLDMLRLRRDPQLFADIWIHIMVKKWGWKPLQEDDLRHYYPGGIPIGLLPAEKSEQSISPLLLRAPPKPTLPPDIARLVDRYEQITELSRALDLHHLALIIGMPGVGKTSLASMLAQRRARPERIFWHNFLGDSDVTNLMWKLAGFLYWSGEEWPWLWLQNASQNSGQPLAPRVVLDVMYELLLGRDYYLCLDDFQQVESDPPTREFAERLHEAARLKTLSLIVTSRSAPSFLQDVFCMPLTGMSKLEAKQLYIERHMPAVSENLFDRIYDRTGGNPQLLELVIVAIRHGDDPQRLADALELTDHVGGYLFDQVDHGLHEQDRQVMIAVALLNPAATRGAVEAVLMGQRVSQSINRLSRQQLLQSEQLEAEPIYSLHATLQAFYSRRVPSIQERQNIHLRAAKYFETEAKDVLQAAYHFLEAKVVTRAAHLATADIWFLINQGRARQLAQVLDRFAGCLPNPLDQASLEVSRGDVYKFLCDIREARCAYEAALTQLQNADSSLAVGELRARAHLGMGDLFHQEALHDALSQLQQGLDELGDGDSPVRTALLIKIGTVHLALGQSKEALSSVQKGLDLLPDSPSHLRMRALTTQGAVYSSQGDVVQGHTYTLEALGIAELLMDRFHMLSILGNSGLENTIAGRWHDAEADYERAIDIAQKISNMGELAKLENNLGTLYINMGHLDSALAHLTHGQELAEDLGFHVYLAHILTSLGDLYIRRGDWQAAEVVLAEAQRLAQDAGSAYPLSEIYFLHSQVHRAAKRVQDAKQAAQHAVDLAHGMNLTLSEGKAWRALGQALLSEGLSLPALDAFQRSLDLLAGDAYEASRTKAAWGLALMREALDTFESFGAGRDLADCRFP